MSEHNSYLQMEHFAAQHDKMLKDAAAKELHERVNKSAIEKSKQVRTAKGTAELSDAPVGVSDSHEGLEKKRGFIKTVKTKGKSQSSGIKDEWKIVHPGILKRPVDLSASARGGFR